jgi:hypothetical protein
MAATRFEAPWDGGVRLATAFVVGLVVVLAAVLVGVSVANRGDGRGIVASLVSGVALVVPLLLLWASWREAPLGYLVEADAIRVERRAGPVVVPLASVREVRALPDGLSFRRVGGTGGFFGYHGEYRNASLGQVRLEATRSTGRVLVDAGAARYVLTPADPAGFLAAVATRRGTT